MQRKFTHLAALLALPGCIVLVIWLTLVALVADDSVEAQSATQYTPLSLAVSGDTEITQGSFPPGRVVFMSDRDNENINLYIVNTDGTGLTRLTDNLRSDELPKLSPDGTKVAFQSYRNGNWDVCVVDVAAVPETNLRCLTEGSLGVDGEPSLDAEPSWSPDGSQLAFTSDRGENQWFRVYIMNADGSNIREITTGSRPDWSPDGQQLVFRDWEPTIEKTNIYTIPATGGERTELTTLNADDTAPVWSSDGNRIAFVSDINGNQDIFTINADGTGLTQHTTSPFRDNDPAWLPDSNQLIFASNRAESFDLYVLNIAGDTNVRLFEPGRDVHRTEAHPDWGSAMPPIGATPTPIPTATRTPPAGTATPIVPVDDLTGCIAFASNRESANNNIYATNANNSSGLVRLTNDTGDDTNPDVTADCGKVVFQSKRSGDQEIYVLDVAADPETNLRRLTNSPGFDGEPVWSPDGSQIAFTSDRTNYFAIFIMDADGSNVRELTGGSTPAWSPDGTRIVHRDWNVDNNDIFVIAADATDPLDRTALTSNPALDADPDWSPDGSKITFTTNRDGNDEIYVMNADGSNQTRLTRNIDKDTGPVWSPDGTQILFESARESFFDLYIIDATEPFNEINEISLLAVNRVNSEEVDPAWSSGSLPVTASPTPTSTPTQTTVPPTSTPTQTTVPPTSTPTQTTVPPTSTPTNTTIPSTSTPTQAAATATPGGVIQNPVSLSLEATSVEINTTFALELLNSGIPNLAGIRFVLAYDPARVTCDDRAAGFPGADMPIPQFSILPNGCDNGRYEFVGVIQGSAVRIPAGRTARIIFQARDQPGATTIELIELELTDPDGNSIPADIGNVAVTSNITADTISGRAACQAGTERQARIFVSTEDGTGIPTGIDLGLSPLNYAASAPRAGNPYSVIATCDCHIPARKLGVNAPATGNNVTLKGGDIDDNQQINLFDIMAIAMRFGQAPGPWPCTDLNQDGTVSLPDLTVALGNLGATRFEPFDATLRTSAAGLPAAPAKRAATGGNTGTPLQQTDTTLACRFEPATISASEQTTLVIAVSNVTNLYGYSVELTPDSTSLTMADTALALGSFVRPDIEIQNTVAPDGTLRAAASQRFDLNPAAVSGSGELARISVQGTQQGSYRYSFGETLLGNMDLAAIEHQTSGCTLVVNDTPPGEERLYLPLIRR